MYCEISLMWVPQGLIDINNIDCNGDQVHWLHIPSLGHGKLIDGKELLMIFLVNVSVIFILFLRYADFSIAVQYPPAYKTNKYMQMRCQLTPPA